MRPRICRECGAPIVVKGRKRRPGRPRLYCEKCAPKDRREQPEHPLSDRLKRAFRDWVIENNGREWTRADLQAELPCAGRTSQRLTIWGEKRGLIVNIFPNPVRMRGECFVYRYVEAKELSGPKRRPRRRTAEDEAIGAKVGRAKPPSQAAKPFVIANREIRKLARPALQTGWKPSWTGTGHLRLTPPDGGDPVVMPKSPSDHRGLKNARAKLRRAGVSV